MPIQWKNSYSVGVAAMDREHQRFFDVMRELDSALAIGSGQLVVRKVLDELIHWAEQHFLHEELLMARHDFPELDAHRAAHDEARRQIEIYERDYALGKQGVPVSLLLFLQAWLRQHILTCDLQYGAYMNHRGIV